jgi:hypothetical protein
MIRLPLNGSQHSAPLRVVSGSPPTEPGIEQPNLPVEAGKSFLDPWVCDYDEFPSLRVAGSRCSQRQVYEAKDHLIVDRIRP